MNRLQLPFTVGTKLPIAMVGRRIILMMGDIFDTTICRAVNNFAADLRPG
jgi:hypothetical protein